MKPNELEMSWDEVEKDYIGDEGWRWKLVNGRTVYILYEVTRPGTLYNTSSCIVESDGGDWLEELLLPSPTMSSLIYLVVRSSHKASKRQKNPHGVNLV